MSGQAYITRVASFLPGAPVENDDIERILGNVGGNVSRARRPVLRSNGIRQRYYAIDPITGESTHTAAGLAAQAVRQLAGDGFTLEQMDCLACGTSLPDQLMPSHGSMVHGELGAAPCEVMATAGICLSGMSAMKYAMMGVKSGEFHHAVASAAERASGVMRGSFFRDDTDVTPSELEKRPTLAFEKDFLRFMLSDGAGAVLIEPAAAPRGLSLRIDWILSRSYANEITACMYAGAVKQPDGGLLGWMDQAAQDWLPQSVFALKQDARQLNEHIVSYTIERGLCEVQRAKGLVASDVDWFLPHYSSEYFRDKVAAGMSRVGFSVPMDRWFTNLTTKGNTGSASIYIMLDEFVRSGRPSAGDRILCFVPESGRFSTAYMLLTVCDASA